jgi:hypothetical protein
MVLIFVYLCHSWPSVYYCTIILPTGKLFYACKNFPMEWCGSVMLKRTAPPQKPEIPRRLA